MGWVEFVADEVVEVGEYKFWARVGALRELGSAVNFIHRPLEPRKPGRGGGATRHRELV